MSINGQVVAIANAADSAAMTARVDEIALAMLIAGLRIMHNDESLVMLTGALARVAEHVLATCVVGDDAERRAAREGFLDITSRLTAGPCRPLIGGGL